MKDVVNMEIGCNVTILPDIAKSTVDIKAFSKQDECDYLIRNGMYYKKERNKVSKKIEHLKAILSQAELPKVANKFEIWYMHSHSLLVYFLLN